MEKRKIYSIIIGVFFLISIGGLVAQIYMSKKDICNDISLESLKKHISINDKTRILNKKNYGNVCEVILDDNDQVSICYATKDFAIKGAMFIDNRNASMANLYNYISSEFISLKKNIDTATCIYYRPQGEIRHTVYMFENPDCQHCKDALFKLRGKLDKYHAELRILFSVSGEVRLKSIDIVCRNVNLDSFIDQLYSDDKPAAFLDCSSGSNTVDKATALGKKLFVTGVPVFFLENGMMVQGDNVTILEEALKR
jgi:thiol:disulfide interchange protein DsbC